MKEIQNAINVYIGKEGLKMAKLLQPASIGIFTSSSAVYDKITARSWEEVSQLNDKGYYINEDIDVFLLNAIMDPLSD